MAGQSLDRALGVYAEETSGFTEGQPVRGYFGRGIKDAILGLGEGTVVGIVDDQEHQAWLGIRDGRAHYEAREPVHLGAALRPNSTSVEVTVTRSEITIPQWQNLRARLLLHFALRDILSDDSRAVVVRTLDANGNLSHKAPLNYQFPRAQLVHDATKPVPNTDTSCRIVVHRADDQLDTPREQGYNAQAGLLIKGENAILDNTLLKFDGDVNAQRFYGSVTCQHLDDLLRRNEPILLATRDGLDRAHWFVQQLFDLCEEVLEPLVQQESERVRRELHRVQNRDLQQKLDTALSRLNRIARDELAELDPLEPGDLRDPYIPPSGFGFVPEYANVLIGRRKSLLLRALARIVPAGSTVTLSSDDPTVDISAPTVVVEPRDDFEWIVEATVAVEGVQVGAEAIIVAECEGLTSEALVRIVARPEHQDQDPPRRRRRGLFGEIRFSEEADPRQRVRYDRDSKDIIVAVNHSSVHPYIGDASGTGTETAQGQVILAELISEAICGAIARHGVETGRFAAPVGGEVEAIQNHQLRLQNQYSGRIHEAIVAPEYRIG